MARIRGDNLPLSPPPPLPPSPPDPELRSIRETIISFAQGEKTANVYSLAPRIWRRCERAGGRLAREGGPPGGKITWKEYEVPIQSVKIVRPKTAGPKTGRRKAEAQTRQRASAQPPS